MQAGGGASSRAGRGVGQTVFRRGSLRRWHFCWPPEDGEELGGKVGVREASQQREQPVQRSGRTQEAVGTLGMYSLFIAL